MMGIFNNVSTALSFDRRVQPIADLVLTNIVTTVHFTEWKSTNDLEDKARTNLFIR